MNFPQNLPRHIAFHLALILRWRPGQDTAQVGLVQVEVGEGDVGDLGIGTSVENVRFEVTSWDVKYIYYIYIYIYTYRIHRCFICRYIIYIYIICIYNI
jgi:hypothetical protein